MNSKTFLIFLLGFFVIKAGSSQENPRSVLFVGNSYTYFWNLPQLVQAMARAGDLEMTTSRSTAGGAHFGHHVRGDRNLSTIEKIGEGNYDAVVLQNHSLSTFERPDSMMLFGRRLAEVAKEDGSEIYLFMTWAREWNPYMLGTIEEKYKELGDQIGAIVVPVGVAWQRARELRPELQLYFSDGTHPSLLGSYLSACVFYAVLTGRSPVSLPNHLSTKDEYGEQMALAIINANDAHFCQKVAEEVVEMWTSEIRVQGKD